MWGKTRSNGGRSGRFQKTRLILRLVVFDELPQIDFIHARNGDLLGVIGFSGRVDSRFCDEVVARPPDLAPA